MSLIIKGMEMPKNGGYEVRLVVYKEGLPSLSVTVENVTTTYTLAELPTPHGRLIDADELIKKLERHRDMCGDVETQYGIDTAIHILRNIPTIIEAEGVNE